MSLVHKIPPLVSALAFGYGIGMAAPETTIASVRTAVSTVAEDRPRAPMPPPHAAEPAPSIRRASAYGERDESPALTRLREAAARDATRGESCSIDRPLTSRPPRYETTVDREFDDADELDAASGAALSRLQLPDMNIPVTRRTLKYVRFFTREDRGRGMFESWLKRSGRYQELIEGELRERSLPEDLIWVAMIESGFDPRARSPAGAVGLWQFMPATGAVYGLAQSRFVDQRKNPMLATRAASHHLRDLYLRFGAWDLALAAYNMGYEQLLDAIDRYGTTDFNELSRQEAIPRETAAYVPKIMAAAIVANNLERFGFDKVALTRPESVGELAVPAGTKLKIIARAAGVGSKELRALNPDLLTDRIPPGRSDFLMLIPADTVARARAALPAMLEDEPLADEAMALAPVDAMTGRDLLRRRHEREDESLLALLPRPHRRASLREMGDAIGTSSAADEDEAEGVDDDGLRGRHRAPAQVTPDKPLSRNASARKPRRAAPRAD
jgi:membrane-bound lytic murein transglycosylase D